MMILRQAVLRQGRRAAFAPRQALTRSFASEFDTITRDPSQRPNDINSAGFDLREFNPTPTLQENAPPYKPEAILPRSENEIMVKRQKIYDNQRNKFSQTGTAVSPHYEAHKQIYDPPRPSEITLELLLAAQAHMGHSTSLWNPMNSRYIFGVRAGIHIISLEATAAHLRRACRVVQGVAERGGLILYVGTRPGQDRVVVEAAKNAGGCHLFEKWLPGSITNGEQLLRFCEVKAVDEHDREIPGWDEELREMPVLKPDLVVCMNPLENWVMLHECGLHNIPTIGIIDTDADPTWVTYPIPANDDSLRTVQVIAGALGMAGKEGRLARMAKARNGEVTYEPTDLESIKMEE